MALQFPTRAERPGKLPHAAGLSAGVWPEFMYHDPVLERLFGRVIEEYPEYQFYAWDDERGEVVGAGNSIPAAWDGAASTLPDGGIDAVVEQWFEDDPPAPTVLCALQIVIDPDYRGQGLSRLMIQRMAEIGRDHGLDTLIAPVRPSLKHRYPLTPMTRYIEWRQDDGTLLDPWLRTHERLGAKILKVAPRVDAHPRDRRAVGGMDGDGISGERLIRGARRARSGRGRPRARRRALRRAERVDGAPASLGNRG